jgi:rubredoxin
MEDPRAQPRRVSSHTDHHAGAEVRGAFRCSDCSYGITIYRSLPVCPMCGGTSWTPMPARRIANRFAGPAGRPADRSSDGERRAA